MARKAPLRKEVNLLRTPHGAGVTILDIAKALNISHTTVSRALAGHEHISDETKAKVSLAVKQMGYVPNASARTMRGRKSSLVGLVIPDIENDFYATIAKIVADALAADSMQLMLCVTEDDPEREERELRALMEARPAGVLIVASASPRKATLAMLQEVECVQLIREHAGSTMNSVLIEDRAGTFAATSHLLDYGHRQLAYIGGSVELATGRERLEGFKQALHERGIKPAAVVVGAPRPDFGRHSAVSVMRQDISPTALVFGSSELTLGAMQGLKSIGLEWPRDVSIVGYHDPAWFELIGNGVTTIRLPVNDIASTATRLLLGRIKAESEPAGNPTALKFKPSLIVRGSTAVAHDKQRVTKRG